jgi:hypothetical protein
VTDSSDVDSVESSDSSGIPGGFVNPEPDSSSPSSPKQDEFSELESWGDRLLRSGKPLSAKHRRFCECVASGMTVPQIKETTGYTDSWISILKSNSRIREEIARLQDRIFSETVQQQLQNLGNDAVGVVEQMLRSEDEKLRDRVEAAKWLIEKLTGKARQEVEVGAGSTLLQLLQKLDSIQVSEQGPRDVLEISASDSASEGKPASPADKDSWMDNWVSQNVPSVRSEKKVGSDE